jgi:hypothetical protein
MCYERKSFVSDESKTVKTDQSKEQESKRAEVVGNLLRDADKDAQKSPAKEIAPAK